MGEPSTSDVSVPRRGARPGDEHRDLSAQEVWSACYAPSTSMYFDQHGGVRACCQNTGHLLGDVGRSSLREIWDGAAARQLRAALAGSDFGLGCDFCAWQQAEAGTEGAFAHGYDAFPAGTGTPPWPVQMEFAVTNTCNLQCVMCNGDWSSAIRAQRERRAPLPQVYGEGFYDELREFVPHLRSAKFTGGEPFLGREPLRILDLLDRYGDPALSVNVTTNGTVINRRVLGLVERLRIAPVLSIDGGTAEVYERIRVGASFERVTANLARFVEVARACGREVSLAHCLMVDNWQTFPELLALAEAHDIWVGVNAVRFPERHSLYQLPRDELARVVATMEARGPEVQQRVSGSRWTTWNQQLRSLRGRLDASEMPVALGGGGATGWLGFPERRREAGDPMPWPHDRPWAVEVEVAVEARTRPRPESATIVAVRPGPDPSPLVDDDLVGQPLAALRRVLQSRTGGSIVDRGHHGTDLLLAELEAAGRVVATLAIRPVRSSEGLIVGGTWRVHLEPGWDSRPRPSSPEDDEGDPLPEQSSPSVAASRHAERPPPTVEPR